MLLFCQLWALTIVSLAACYALGTVMLRLLRVSLPNELLFECFLRLLSGLVLLAAGYAAVRTRGNTILLPLLVLLPGVLYLLRREAATEERHLPAFARNWRAPATVLLVGTVVFLGQYLLLYEPGSPFLQTPFQDYVYYSRLTLMLNQMGLESRSLEVVFPQFQTVQPYHYLEVWFNALLVRLTGLPSVWVFFVSASGVLITICGIGFGAIYAYCRLRLRWAVLLGLLTLTVMGTVWPPLVRFQMVVNSALLAHLPLPLNPKLAPIYLFEILAALLLLRHRFQAAGLALAALPLVFIATAPAVGVGVAGLALYLWQRQRLPFRKAVLLVAPTVAALLYVVVFYTLQPERYQFPATGRSHQLAAILPGAGELKTMLNISVGVVVMYALYTVGYGMLVALVAFRRRSAPLKTTDWPLAAWFVATVAGAVLMRTVGHHFMDGFQFFSNPIIPLTAIMVAVLLGRALRGARFGWPLLVAGALGALAVVGSWYDDTQNTRFSPEFLQRVGPVLRSLPNRGGFLMGDADYKNGYMMSADSYTSGTYVSAFKNDYVLLSLSVFVPDSLSTDPRYARDSAQAEQIRRNTTLFRLAKLRSLAHRPLLADSLPVAMVRKAGLAFICASRRATLPAALRPLVKASYRDGYSGEVLYVLKPLQPSVSR